MRIFAIELGGKSGDYIRTLPASRSEEPQIGKLDVAFVALSLLCVFGLIYLLVG